MASPAVEENDAEAIVLAEVRRRIVGRRSPLIVAIDGRSGAGKSTLAARIADAIGGVVIDGDDFYSGGTDADWAARSAAEKAHDCIDWRRLRRDALEPLRAGRTAFWHPFDFAAGAGLAAYTVSRSPAAVVVLDGVYSARPELSDLVDVAVMVVAPTDTLRRHRLVEREGQTSMAAWHAIWDEAETHYFVHIRPPESFDLIVTPG